MKRISRRNALALLGMGSVSIALFPSISLAAPKTILCNWDKNFAPYSWEHNGAMTGILVDCMDELLGKRMGFNVVHRGLPWEEAQDMVRSGQGDALCTNPTDTRQQFMVFSEEPVVESLPSIFCAVDNPRLSTIKNISSLDDLKAFRQVDYKGNGWAQRTFPPS